MKKIIKFFDKLEDRIRGRLSMRPIIYALIGGVCMVTFWRGIWHTGDILMAKGGILGFIFYEPITIIWTTIIMLLIGVFASFFVGESIVLSGLKHDKKVYEKTAEEVAEEEGEIVDVTAHIEIIEKELTKLSEKVSRLKNK
jgi:hypothetical protein